MNSARLEQLLMLLKETPDDPFLHYALALEYMKSDLLKSGELLTRLIENHPDYLPAYYQAGQINEQTGHPEAALNYYSKGIALAQTQKDHATMKELQAALNLLTDELSD